MRSFSSLYYIVNIHCYCNLMAALPLHIDADLPPSYDIAAKLPTYEEAERVKEQHDDLVSYRRAMLVMV